MDWLGLAVVVWAGVVIYACLWAGTEIGRRW